MMEGHKSPKPWLLWAYDPCPEGGWHIENGFDTREEAEAAAKAYHGNRVAQQKERVERFKERGRTLTWSFACYGGVMVTPGEVFSLDVDFQSEGPQP